MQVDESPVPIPDSGAVAPNGSRGSRRNEDWNRRIGEDSASVTEEVLTYDEAARLLKISARTLERWTRERLVPYIRLPQRGRWSGVRFSRSELLRWLRRRTIRTR